MTAVEAAADARFAEAAEGQSAVHVMRATALADVIIVMGKDIIKIYSSRTTAVKPWCGVLNNESINIYYQYFDVIINVFLWKKRKW